MKQQRKLDFKCLPLIDEMDIFIRLDRLIEKRFGELSFLTETHERAQSALMFFFQTGENDVRWRNDARLRAGLNEFYSIEAAARRDFRLAERCLKPPCIAESQSPLVHLMYVLRHANVHTRPTITRVQPIIVTSELGGTTHEHKYGAVILDNVSVADLLQRDRDLLDYYSNEDIEQSLNWLLEKQQTFGISEVFRAGINVYCSEIFGSLE